MPSQHLLVSSIQGLMSNSVPISGFVSLRLKQPASDGNTPRESVIYIERLDDLCSDDTSAELEVFFSQSTF